MSIRREWINRFRHFVGRRSFEDGLEEEIRFHMESRVADLERAGLTHSAALMQARREFGSRALARENSRAPWNIQWLQDFAADLRFGFRACWKNPAFTLTAVLSLGLGIGGASAIYNALDAILWRPLPVADPNSLVGFSITRAQGPPETGLPAAFIDQLRASNTFANLIVTIADGLSFSYDARAERILGEIVAPDYFTALGVPALLGQTFTPEVRNGHWAAEAVLSYNFWQRRLGGDPAVIGRTIHLNTYPFTIVGVSAPSFSGIVRGTDYELRIPMLPPGRELAQMEQASGSPKRWLDVMARLKPGSNIAQAESAADAQLQQFLRTTPLERFSKAGLRRMHLSPAPRGYDEYVLPFRDPLYILLVLVGIVLLIACSNVASMLLARATARSREFAIRTSIGAGRFRLIRQMLAESLLLAIAGGVLGVAIANWGANIVFHFLPQGHIAFAIDLHPDVHILFLTLAVSLLVGIGVGLAPAVQAARQNLAATMKAESAASVGAGRGARLRKLLVMSQVAFSLVLLIAAGAFVRTLTALRPADYRSNPSRILLFTLKPQVELYNDERKFHLAAELIRRVSALPGVRLAALAENGPLGSRDSDGRFQAPGGAPIRAGYDVVSRGFFDTVGIPRLAGRDFNITDYAQSPQVAIVNWSFAHELFPDQNPIGRTISLLTGKQDGKYEIIGVVADTHYFKVH